MAKICTPADIFADTSTTSSPSRPDARWHDLRHTGAVLAAQTGATLADKVIAEALSALATKDL